MREINECTEEVFRRSEKRIKELRRKRSRVLAVCIPFFLAAAVWSAIIFPPMMPAEEGSDRAQVDGAAAEQAPESLACPYAAVEIQAAGIVPEEYYGKVTDRLAVAEMFEAVNSLFADADGNDQRANGNLPAEGLDGNDLSESANKPKGCTITFTTEDGSRSVYQLSEHTLVNVSTNETACLSDDQTAGLLAALGLSE